MFWNTVERMDCRIIYTTVLIAIKSLYKHSFGSFTVVYLYSIFVEHPVVMVIVPETMAGIHSTFTQNSEDQIDFFI